jgi:hypothetical protein
MIHAFLAILTTYLFWVIYNLISYHYVLCENIDLADDDAIFEKLKGSVFEQTIFQADEWVGRIRQIYLPAWLLSLIGVLGVWIPFGLGYPPTLFVSVIAAIVIAFTISQHIVFDYYPKWVLDWYNVLVAAHLQIRLEFVKGELKAAHSKLLDVKSGALVLSDQELAELQTHALAMSQETLQVSTIIKEMQQPTD